MASTRQEELAPPSGSALVEAEETIAQRCLNPWWGRLFTLIAIAFVAFQLYTSAVGPFTAIIQRAVHLSFILSMLFLIYPATRRSSRSSVPFYDLVLAALGVMIAVYVVTQYGAMVRRQGLLTGFEVLMGGLTVVLVLEATRRTVGTSIVIIAICFLAYAYFGRYVPGMLGHRGFTIEEIAAQMFLFNFGIFGIPLGVSATVISSFVIFGAFLAQSGCGKLFVDLAYSLAGRTRGGSAKASVISSALFGTVSGSAVANVVVSGTFTIPLMKRSGYSPVFAGAVEAVASSGGQLMPPVMGATAFIMAEMTGIPYAQIALAAALPAILYYVALFTAVDLEALKEGVKGLPASQLPKTLETLKWGGHLFVPLIVLIYLLADGASPTKAAFYTILALLALTLLRKDTRMGPRELLDAAEKAARGMLGIGAVCATAGIIVGVISLTGAGLTFTGSLLDLSGGNLFVLLFLTMIASLVLGLGLPTSAAYILLAVLAAPALTKLGIQPIVAHLFIFYYGTISVITPPVATAAYAGAAIAKANPDAVGWLACRLGLVAFIIPFMFVYGPALVLQGTPLEVISAMATAIVGCIFLAAAIEGYLLRRMWWYERLLSLVGALLLVQPGLATDLPGISMVASVIAIQWYRRRRTAITAPTANG